MLRAGGFNIRKWASSLLSIKALENQEIINLGKTEDNIKKTLGIYWIPHQDSLTYQVKLSPQQRITKRTILSEIAKIFDPLGLLAPIIIKAKLLMQELWLNQISWDEEVSPETADKWGKFQQELQIVENITIPRWINYKHDGHIELHGFCDASEKAYGAAIYIKTTQDGSTNVVLLTAKSKVAPIKMKKTLPKLELCAATLLANMVKKAITALEIPNLPVYTWTDSMITLAWIKGSPEKWKNFVSNRVAEIQQLTGSKCWQHVKSEDNPADLVSRGIEPSKLQNHQLWWNGPTWLRNKEQWPKASEALETEEEAKRCHHVAVKPHENPIINRFSTLKRMVRVLSYCNRFIKNSKGHIKLVGALSAKEMDTTLTQIIRIAQHERMETEFKTLKKHHQVEKNSKLISLNPFIDNAGIIRVGGRLQNSLLPYNEKHPIILPYESHLSKLIIQDAHENTLHGGKQSTLAYTRRKYWIINGKRAVQSIIHKCIKCVRYRAQTAQQLMGELPAPRVTPSQPFSHTGVDYAGPIPIRTTKGRGNKSYKGYIAIFVCLATKAIHLEVVSDMSTETFIAAFKRFTARRGPCTHMYSDNGTNFVGASNLLRKEIQQVVNNSTVQDKLASCGVQWHFIPPSAPHFGGLWEAGVKSMKYNLKRVIGDATLTFEELTTLMYQIEACLNSRPLCPLDDSINDTIALTPGHFLIGREIISPPDPITNDITTNLNSRWKIVHKMKKDFWKSWASEYLCRLQQRYKWKSQEENLKIGDLVIIKEDNINPSRWPLARITEVQPGKDGIVRVVTVQSKARQQMKRPITKVCPLPINRDEEHPQHDSTKPKQTTGVLSVVKTVFTLMVVFSGCIQTSYANYTIKNPAPGIYIEDIGHAKIDRGIFRLGVNFSISNFLLDEQTINDTFSQFNTLCNKAKGITEGTHCDELIHHITEKQQEILWNMASIRSISNHRTKRGVLGKLLTAVFGVNDEVYRDIDSLDKNQNQLIQASNHQAKLMVAAMSTINETEARISEKLENFRTKFNQGLQAINDMQVWYKAIDINKLNIHILTTYQLAINYLEELSQKYSKLLDASFKRGHLFQFLTPSQVTSMITKLSQKLPSVMVILPSPVYKMDIRQNTETIEIFGFFHITEVTNYDVIKATPIPTKLDNGTFMSLDISSQFVAIDYYHQKYFEIPDNKFEASIPINENVYLCSPTVVSSIENNPNCVIDELYERHEKSSCTLHHLKITSLVWKELYMVNTWLYITNEPTRAAVICNNIREDVILTNTGIIQVSPECTIETKRNTLHPKTFRSIPVLATYSRNLSITINSTLPIIHTRGPVIEPEPVLKSSDKMTAAIQEATDLQQQLSTNHWHTIHNRSTIVSSMTTIIIISICVMIYFLWKRCRKPPPPTTQSDEPSHQLMGPTPKTRTDPSSLGRAKDFCLQPLNVAPRQ